MICTICYYSQLLLQVGHKKCKPWKYDGMTASILFSLFYNFSNVLFIVSLERYEYVERRDVGGVGASGGEIYWSFFYPSNGLPPGYLPCTLHYLIKQSQLKNVFVVFIVVVTKQEEKMRVSVFHNFAKKWVFWLVLQLFEFFVNKSYHTVTLHFMVGPVKHEFFQSIDPSVSDSITD